MAVKKLSVSVPDNLWHTIVTHPTAPWGSDSPSKIVRLALEALCEKHSVPIPTQFVQMSVPSELVLEVESMIRGQFHLPPERQENTG